METIIYQGVGKKDRRLVIRLWKSSGTELSLKQWAAKQHPVGDVAYAWLQGKRRKQK